MLKIILFTLTLSVSAFAQIQGNDITCALESSNTNLQKASIVLTFEFLGNNVYEMRTFTAYTRAQHYRTRSGSFDGTIFRFERLEDDIIKFGNRIRLNENTLKLIKDVTGGGYPGAGSPPQRANHFKCLLNYGPTRSIDVTKNRIKSDFNL